MATANLVTRIPPIIIEYGGIGRESALPTTITNHLTESQVQDFESVLKIGIIKQLERNGVLSTEQSAVLVSMQRGRDVWTHER